MALSDCMTCVKYMMFAFNFLFWLCGCALLCVGLWLCFDPTVREYTYAAEELEEYYIAVYVLIGIGGLMMLIGFLGCCGSCLENTCLLCTFFMFLMLICILEVGGGLFAYFKQTEVETLIKKKMPESLSKYGSDNQVKKAIDTIQNDLSCCGVNGPLDWRNTSYYSENDIPQSCCINKNSCSMKNIPNSNTDIDFTTFNIKSEGCAGGLYVALQQNVTLVAGLVIGIGAVQVLGMIFSLCLCCAIRNSDKNYPV
ncbi:CD9 antigen-like [Anneissia japonica]|uniref:CD9 antigen-like n=1 Tax=Anneissia japonica TaxID=1529436 RepID=UPI001425942D|nr:CD9 antigen-like [Anneissia japonica]